MSTIVFALFILSLVGFSVVDQLDAFYCEKKTTEYVTKQTKASEKLQNQYQYITFLRSGPYKKSGSSNKGEEKNVPKRSLYEVPLNIRTLGKEDSALRQALETTINQIYFQEFPHLNRDFFYHLYTMLEEKGEDFSLMVFFQKLRSVHRDFGRILKGDPKKKIPPMVCLLSISSRQDAFPIYHMNPRVLEVFFSQSDLKKIQQLKQDYLTGTDNETEMDKLIKRNKLTGVFSSTVLKTKPSGAFVYVQKEEVALFEFLP